MHQINPCLFQTLNNSRKASQALRSCLNVANGGRDVLSQMGVSEMCMFFNENKRLLREEMAETTPRTPD